MMDSWNSFREGTGKIAKFDHTMSLQEENETNANCPSPSICSQIKLRGYRVELGEVEAVVSECSVVSECVIMAIEDLKMEKRLVCYFTSGPSVAGDMTSDELSSKIRSEVRSRLPVYMLPTVCVHLKAFPMTGTGKIDRNALPPVDWDSVTEIAVFEPPRNAVEESLCEIYAEVLGVSRVGIQDNFFELGGHSLLIAQIITRVRALFNVDLSFTAVFKSQTVSSLAEKIGHMISFVADDEHPGLCFFFSPSVHG
jgi:acyl carrier protein